MKPSEINEVIKKQKAKDDDYSAKEISDGHHTFGELYYHRMMLTCVLFNMFSHLCHKSWLHDDGTMFDDSFIVSIETPEGPYSYHYNSKYWDMFDVVELDRSRPYDGHKPKDITRLMSLLDTPITIIPQ